MAKALPRGRAAASDSEGQTPEQGDELAAYLREPAPGVAAPQAPQTEQMTAEIRPGIPSRDETQGGKVARPQTKRGAGSSQEYRHVTKRKGAR